MPQTNRPPSSGEQAAIRGYFKQYEFSAVSLYRHMLEGNLQSLCLLSEEAGVFDDFVVLADMKVKATQIKSEHNATYVSLKTEFSSDLLEAMIASWQDLRNKFESDVTLTYIFAGLFSTNDTGLANSGSSGARHSAEFAGFISRDDLTPEIVNSSIWSDAIVGLQKKSGLDQDQFYEFVRCVTLEDERVLIASKIDAFNPDDRGKIEQIRDLLPNLVRDASPGDVWYETDLVERLGWQSRLSQRNSHTFPLPQDYQENAATEALIRQIGELSAGYLALVGPPGTGKSTLLQRELYSTDEYRITRYLAFHPDHRHGLGRAEAVDFLNDVIADLYAHGIGGSRYRSDSLAGLRQEFARQLHLARDEFQTTGRKTIITIDGLDHVPREETPEVSFLQELPAANAVPEGVLIVLGSQRLDLPGIAPTILQQVGQDGRTIMIEPLSRRAIADIADNADLPAFVDRSKLYDCCEGHPLSARYYVEALSKAVTAEVADQILGSDGLGQSIEQIYERVWQKVEHIADAKPALALLARAEANLSCEQLASFTSDQAVELVLRDAGFLLKRTACNRLSVFHNSFRLFVSRSTATRFGRFDETVDAEFQATLATIAERAPEDDAQHWYRLRYLSRARKFHDVVNLGDAPYFRASLRALRPEEAVFTDLRLVFGAIHETKDRVSLLRTLLIHKEVSYRCEAVSEIDFVGLLKNFGEPELAFDHALATGDTGEGWLDIVDYFWDAGQHDLSRQLFEANEPLELFYGEDGFNPNQQMELAEGWIQRAHRFRPVDKLLGLVEGLVARRPIQQAHDDEDHSWASGRLKFHLALGMLDDGYDNDLTSLQSLLHFSDEECATLAIHAAECSLAFGDTEKALERLAVAKSSGSLSKAHQSWRRAATQLALRLDDSDFATEMTASLVVPRLDREAMSRDMRRLAMAIVETERLAASLGIEIPEEPRRERLEPSDLLSNAHANLRRLGRLRGLVNQQAHGVSSKELKTIVLYFSSAKPDRGDFDGHKYYAALPIIANQVLKTAQSAGTEVLNDIVSLIDTLMADEASNFSGSNAFRLAFAQNTFKINGDTDQATDRIRAVESARQFFHTPHEAAEFFVSVARAYSAIGRIDLAKSSLGKMHEHTFGYWLRAKKEPQYDFWKWIYGKACEECPEIMEAGALSFAQFLLGMEETEGKGTAYRVYRCLVEGSSFSPAVTAGIVSRLLDSGLVTWAGVVEASLVSVVKGDPSLAPLAVTASAQLVVPFAEDSLPRLLKAALPILSEQDRAQPIYALVRSVERWCPPSKRELILEEIIEHAPEARVALEPLLASAAEMASELRRIGYGESRNRESEPSYGGEIDVGSLTELIAYGEGKNRFGGGVDYSYAKAAEALIPKSTEAEILGFLSERPHIETSAKCMVAVARWFLDAGERQKVEKYVERAQQASINGHWSSFLGGEKLAVQKLIAEYSPQSAPDTAFGELTGELARGATDASSLFLNLDEVLELVSDSLPVSDFWAETQEHLENYREAALVDPVVPIPSVETPLDLLAYVMAQGFNLSCPQVIAHAREATVDVVRISGGTSFFEKLVVALSEFPDGYREAVGLANRLTDVSDLSVSLIEFALRGLETSDIVVSALSEKMLAELGHVPPTNPAVELPAFYKIQAIGGGQSSNFDPPPGLLSDGRTVWSDDPWTWTSMLRFPLSVTKDASGIPMETLRRRCAYFMQQEGGKEAFGPEVEKEQRAKLRCLSLPFPNRRPMASAALRAIGKLLSELYDANAIDPRAFPAIWEEIGGPNAQNSMPLKGPKPDWLEWPDVPLKQNGGADIENWLGDAGKHFTSALVAGGRLFAEKTHFALHSTRSTVFIDKLALPSPTDSNSGSDRLPRVFSLDDPKPMYDENESKGVCRVPGNLYGDFQDDLIVFCPHLALRLNWVAGDDDPFSYFDQQGNAVCETVRWVQGTYEYQPTYEAEMFGRGQFVYLTKLGVSQIQAAGINFLSNVKVEKSAQPERKPKVAKKFVASFE